MKLVVNSLKLIPGLCLPPLSLPVNDSVNTVNMSGLLCVPDVFLFVDIINNPGLRNVLIVGEALVACVLGNLLDNNDNSYDQSRLLTSCQIFHQRSV